MKPLDLYTYVKDTLLGADTIEKETQIRDQVENLLKLGQFELRK